MSEISGLGHWVEVLTQSELPVLRHTARELAVLREDEEKLSANSVADAIALDPMMTVKLLRYLQQHKHKVQTTEIIQVEQALMMLGMKPFFNQVPPEPIMEDVLKPHLAALPHLLRVVHRSHRASEYARDWAVQLHDLHYEEVRIAALLHDIAELLMWCFAPVAMLNISAMQQQDRALRSNDVQQQVLGFTLIALQKELAEKWGLPHLLNTLMDDSCAQQQRVRNVVLAVNLARHSANGWDDAALPDDYKGIGDLLRIPSDQVRAMVEA